jgi:hypothetical protein
VCRVVVGTTPLLDSDDDEDNDEDSRDGTNRNGVYCRVLSYSATSTTCLCRIPLIPLMPFASDGSGNGGTSSSGSSSSSSSSSGSILQASGAMKVVAMAEYTVDGFAGTLYEADNITLNDFKNSYIVIGMFVIMWGCGIMGLFQLGRISNSTRIGIDGNREKRDSKVHMTHRRSNLGGRGSVGSTQDLEEMKTYLMAYIDKVVPAVFRSTGSCWKSMWKELSTHHR